MIFIYRSSEQMNNTVFINDIVYSARSVSLSQIELWVFLIKVFILRTRRIVVFIGHGFEYVFIEAYLDKKKQYCIFFTFAKLRIKDLPLINRLRM